MWSTVCQYFTQKDRENRPLIDIEIENCPTEALIDSGSQASLISIELWNELKKRNPNLTLGPAESSLKAANGSIIHVMGAKMFKTTFNNNVLQLTFIVVAGLKCNCLIGADIMDKIGMHLDMKNKKISIDGPLMIRNKKKLVVAANTEVCQPFELSRECGKEVLVPEWVEDMACYIEQAYTLLIMGWLILSCVTPLTT